MLSVPAPVRLAALAVAPLTALALAAPAAGAPPTRDTAHAPTTSAERFGAQLARAVDGRGVRALRAFQRIADRDGGTRGYDQPGFTDSARYVLAKLRQAGYHPWVERVPYTDFVPQQEYATEVAPRPHRYGLLMTRWVPSTPKDGITAPVAVLPPGADGCSAADYAGFAGRIAVVPRGACGYTAAEKLAAAAGAVAFVIYYPTPSPQNNYRFIAFTPSDFTIPMGSIAQRDGEQIIEQARQGTVTLHVVLRGRAEHHVTENILAETAGGRRDNVVMVGGHLDSVTEGPGINDNGSTAAAVLATALALAPRSRQHRLVNAVRFAWWGAEELYDVGSFYYVDHLTSSQLSRIKVLLNGELLGSPNYVRHVWDGGPAGGHAAASLFERYFDQRGLPYEVVSPDTVGSDHEGFEEHGIPVTGLDSGLLTVKTPEEAQVFGGLAGQLEDPCYHQACDTLSDMNLRVFGQDARAFADVTGQLAIDDSAVLAGG